MNLLPALNGPGGPALAEASAVALARARDEAGQALAVVRDQVESADRALRAAEERAAPVMSQARRNASEALAGASDDPGRCAACRRFLPTPPGPDVLFRLCPGCAEDDKVVAALAGQRMGAAARQIADARTLTDTAERMVDVAAQAHADARARLAEAEAVVALVRLDRAELRQRAEDDAEAWLRAADDRNQLSLRLATARRHRHPPTELLELEDALADAEHRVREAARTADRSERVWRQVLERERDARIETNGGYPPRCCLTCSAPLEPGDVEGRFCSRSCERAHEPFHGVAPPRCWWCRRFFTPAPPAASVTFCSVRCALAAPIDVDELVTADFPPVRYLPSPPRTPAGKARAVAAVMRRQAPHSDDGEPGASVTVVRRGPRSALPPAPVDEAILAALREGPLSQADLLAKVGLRWSAARLALAGLLRRRLLIREGIGVRGRPRVYRLTP